MWQAPASPRSASTECAGTVDDKGITDDALASAPELDAEQPAGPEELETTRPTFARSVMASVEGLTASLGENVERVIIDWGNDRVMEVLADQLQSGKGSSIVGFHGAAHMPDLESRLLSRCFRRVDPGWNVAWTF